MVEEGRTTFDSSGRCRHAKKKSNLSSSHLLRVNLCDVGLHSVVLLFQQLQPLLILILPLRQIDELLPGRTWY